ncbi:MAG: phosphoglycerate dehydrogenase [Bacteroidales bacterium]|nr:phosphoglycerate dehydrogenase [Bacteroidales bacterium]
MKKILTSPSSYGQISDEPYDLLISNGFEIIKNPYGRKLTEEEVIEIAHDCVGIVAGVESLTAKVMDAMPKLKCISRVGVGMDSVDLDAAKERNIKVVNTPDGPTQAVAELTLGLTFSLLRKIHLADANMKKRVWKKETGNLLFKKKIGIIGLGRIGKMAAASFRALGNEVVGYDLFPDVGWASTNKVEFVDLNTLLKTADIITIHIPAPSAGKPVIGEEEIHLIKPDAFVVNVSRGGVVDEKALYDALLSNKIAGAAIDVFSDEPYDGLFCDLANVVLTPHLGSYAKEGKLQMELDAVKNLMQVLKEDAV